MADHLEHHFSHQAQDESTLAEIGYKQELNRDWSLLHNFGISFSIIVCISSMLRGHYGSLYCFGLLFELPGQELPMVVKEMWLNLLNPVSIYSVR